jgi:hypothetical protein
MLSVVPVPPDRVGKGCRTSKAGDSWKNRAWIIHFDYSRRGHGRGKWYALQSPIFMLLLPPYLTHSLPIPPFALLPHIVWFETIGTDCTTGSLRKVWSTLLQNRWNVFIGAEE